MKTRNKTWMLGAALVALCGLAGTASAGVGSPSYLNIDVTISASKSVSVSTLRTSTQSATFDGSTFTLVPTSTATVLNDSGILSEGWELSTTGHSIDATTGANGWTIAGSTSNLATDNVALQAVFGSSHTASGCPIATAAEWNDSAVAAPLTATPQQYGATLFADTALNNNGLVTPDSGTLLFAGSQRALCWRLSMPTTSTLGTTDVQIVSVIVTAN